ncbi:hypothetical protein SHIRM173S_09154 [Streptomyces hirsutus]
MPVPRPIRSVAVLATASLEERIAVELAGPDGVVAGLLGRARRRGRIGASPDGQRGVDGRAHACLPAGRRGQGVRPADLAAHFVGRLDQPGRDLSDLGAVEMAAEAPDGEAELDLPGAEDGRHEHPDVVRRVRVEIGVELLPAQSAHHVVEFVDRGMAQLLADRALEPVVVVVADRHGPAPPPRAAQRGLTHRGPGRARGEPGAGAGRVPGDEDRADREHERGAVADPRGDVVGVGGVGDGEAHRLLIDRPDGEAFEVEFPGESLHVRPGAPGQLDELDQIALGRGHQRRGGEPPVPAAEEHQGRTRPELGELVDLADDDVVVARLVPLRERAVDPGEGPVDHGCAGGRRKPCDAAELVGAPGRHRAAHVFLVGAEDADAEPPGGLDPGVGARRARRHEAHQGRIERDRTEGPHRHAVGPALRVERRDDRDAGGKLSEDVAEVARVLYRDGRLTVAAHIAPHWDGSEH